MSDVASTGVFDDEDDDECIHGLGPKSACTICNGKAKAEHAEAISSARVVMRWPARYAGLCALCRTPFEVDDTIGRTADDRIVCGDH